MTASVARRRGGLAARVLEKCLDQQAHFTVLDVGCSGGIDQRWYAFGDRLRAVGFDPLLAEVERLNAANTHAGVRYEAAYVGCRDFDRLFPPALRNDRIATRNNQSFPRVSAYAAHRRLRIPYEQQQFNSGAPVARSTRTITLDDFVPAGEHRDVDFLKVDTDGHDIEVLLGAEGIMAAGGLLGLMVEVQLHGPIHEFANTYPNIDRILRQHGFSLFDLPIYRYSRADLPAPFVWDLAAQTISGQVIWGDALYLRDLASIDYEDMWQGYEVTPERVMKLACLFDLFDLPDCAAELLVARGACLGNAQRDELLDVLVSGEPGSYAAYVAAFEADYTSLFPSRLARAPKAPARPSESEKFRQLQQRNEELRERLKERRSKITKLMTRVTELEARRK
jgi:FkbM family methyltransferase